MPGATSHFFPFLRHLLCRWFLPILFLPLVSGCATLSREQCRQGDWFGIGLSDGQAGEPASRIERHARACSEYGIQVDGQRYRDGHEQGLLAYCRIDNAFATGLQGQRYQGVCPPAIDALFERCNRAAYAVYRLRRELDAVEQERDRVFFRLRGTSLTDDDRYRLRRDLRNLDLSVDRLYGDLLFNERLLRTLMDEFGASTPP